MKTEDSCIRLKLSDAVTIGRSALVLPDSRKASAIKAWIHSLQSLCENRVWLTIRQKEAVLPEETNGEPAAPGTSADLAEEITGLFGLQAIDLQSKRYRLHLFCMAEGPDRHLLRSIAHWAMNRQDSYRLELEVGAAEQHWLPELHAAGWQEDGRLRLSRYDEQTSLHENVSLLSLHRPRQSSVGVVFVPFNKAVLAVVGDAAGLFSSCFVRYGERSAEPRIQESAEWLQLLDNEGRLLDRDVLQRRLSSDNWLCQPETPAVLQEAASQIDSYFQGSRSPFGLPLHLEQGSPFQQKVWLALKEIPYGVTRTYAEIACAISRETCAEARKMARAVGSACAANPLPLILPCHRVIGKDGRLVGFSAGLDIKEYLLAHEIMGLG